MIKQYKLILKIISIIPKKVSFFIYNKLLHLKTFNNMTKLSLCTIKQSRSIQTLILIFLNRVLSIVYKLNNINKLNKFMAPPFNLIQQMYYNIFGKVF